MTKQQNISFPVARLINIESRKHDISWYQATVYCYSKQNCKYQEKSDTYPMELNQEPRNETMHIQLTNIL